MLKIFHTADIHIGLKFGNKGYPADVQKSLVQERFEVLRRMISVAEEKQCDLFVIAGDLFDKLNVADKDIKETAGILEKFKGDVVVLPGNHDYFGPDDKLWEKLLKANDRIHLLNQCKHYSLDIKEHHIKFFPGPCTSKHSEQNAIGWIADEELSEENINITVAHGAVEGISLDNEGRYFYMTEQEISSLKMDLVLLGHTHIQLPIKDNDRVLFFMPSTPEPDGFDCSHEGKAWFIELDDNKQVRYESIKTGKHRFVILERQVQGEDDLVQIVEESAAYKSKNVLLKLTLSGALSKSEMETLSEKQRSIEQNVVFLIFDYSEVLENIDRRFIEGRYAKGSLPEVYLSELLDEGDPHLVKLGYDILEEAAE